MKNFLLVVGALVAGLVVGSWQPRGEVLRLRDQLDELSARQRRCNRGSAAAGIRELLRGETPGETDDRSKRRRVEPQEAPVAPDIEEPPEIDAPSGEPDPLADAKTPEAIKAALDARSAQARAALMEQADLDDAQLAAVDQVLAEMNRRLKAEVDQVVADIGAGSDLDRRDLMDLAAESLDAVIAADDGIRAAVGDEAYAALDPEVTDPLSFINGETMASVVQLAEEPIGE